jgi:geranylgeranyl reductase family protein
VAQAPLRANPHGVGGGAAEVNERTDSLGRVIITDLLVVGAGPAGTAAAIDASRGGRRVTVIDKAVFPRDKCCGDGLTTDALRILDDLGLVPDGVENWNAVTDIVIRNPRGRITRLPLPTGGQYAAVVPRLDLDHRLVGLAQQTGADVLQGVAFEGLTQHGDYVVTDTSDGPIASRYVIAADGMWSPVRKHLGLTPTGYRGEWHAFRQYFSNVGPQAQHLVIWFEDDLLPGYAWSFPLPGQRANVGFGITTRGRHGVGDMKGLWEDLLQRPQVQEVLGPDARPEARHKAWPIPAQVDGLPHSSGRVLFVGDAVGATDPMTGEGIAQAMLTGREAAAAINIAGALRPAVATARYDGAIEQKLRPDHVLARQLARMLETELGTRAALRAADLSPWTRRNFARWMFEDYPRAMVLTPNRWHRGMFTGPGAFADTAVIELHDQDLAALG